MLNKVCVFRLVRILKARTKLGKHEAKITPILDISHIPKSFGKYCLICVPFIIKLRASQRYYKDFIVERKGQIEFGRNNKDTKVIYHNTLNNKDTTNDILIDNS